MVNRMILNETSYFGRGARKSIVTEIESRNFKRALVITDKSLISARVPQLVISILDENNITYDIFDDIKPNPTVKNVLTGVHICKSIQADFLIAIGGGSVIDTAKCVGIIMTNPEYADVVSLDGIVATKNKSLPIIALPTTAGTAAEVTINYVITDEARVKKMVCIDPHDIPVVSIIDPDLMQSMPKQLAAATGMDALTHAMEGYLTKSAWLLPDIFHINAMSLIYKNLEKAVNLKDNYAIEQVGYAQYIAGMGFSNVGLGIAHSMSHSLGAFFDIPHGVANALLLPYVLEFNGAEFPQLLRNMGNAMGIDLAGLDEIATVNKVVDSIKQLSIRIGIPQTLQELGVPEKSLEKLAHQAIDDICTSGNPRRVTEKDILDLYRRAYK